MLDITIYDKKGCRHFIDHVTEITNRNGFIVVEMITDFNDQIFKTFSASDVEYIKATVMQGVEE